MTRSILWLWGLLLLGQGLIAQENENAKTGFWELRLGIGVDRFQDSKNSPLKLSGTDVPIGIYRGRITDKSISTGGLEIRSSELSTSVNEQVTLSNGEVNLHFEYLRKLSAQTSLFDTWYLGGRVDFRRQNLENELLGNNSVNVFFNTSLSVVNRVERTVRTLGKDARLSYTLSLSLLNYVKEDNSFSFAAPQQALEDGVYNTQDFEHSLFEYGEVTSLNSFIQLRSRLALHFPAKRRSSWELAYEWQFRNYAQVDQLGIASASHNLSISYHLPKKKN